MKMPINLLGLSQADLKSQIGKFHPSIQNYNVKQLWNWIYNKGETEFENMSNIPKLLRGSLKENATIYYGQEQKRLDSKDGTVKKLINFGEKAQIETVMIPEQSRRTLCVSSQVGCSLSCTFCHTGTQKLLRNLSSGEIIGQYMNFAKMYKEFPINPLTKRKISNIVFMGQGEPLYNHRNVFNAIKILTDPEGINFPKGKIVVSTSGIAPMIPRLAEELGVSLAISLHGVSDDIRNEIVPINKQYNLKALFASCQEFVEKSQPANRRITFEYVMLKNVNDSLSDARELARLIRRFPSHVNIIPFNKWPGSIYECSDENQIKAFANLLIELNIHVTIRFPRGEDILAACGQLKSLELSKDNFKPKESL